MTTFVYNLGLGVLIIGMSMYCWLTISFLFLVFITVFAELLK